MSKISVGDLHQIEQRALYRVLVSVEKGLVPDPKDLEMRTYAFRACRGARGE